MEQQDIIAILTFTYNVLIIAGLYKLYKWYKK